MKRIKIYLYIGIMSFCTSCSDFLDKVPDERTQIDSPDKVSALLVNAYPKVSYAAIVNTRCDYITDFGSVYSGAQPGALFSFMGENFLWKDMIKDGNDSFENFWTGCYAAIAVSNQALVSIDELGTPSSTINQKGEALMTRAFSHFCLASLFAQQYDESTASLYPGIPYVEKPETQPVEQYDRETVADTYRKITQDFEDSYPLMTDGSIYTAPKYHFNKKSAAAFGTRLYLLMKQYDKVLEYANQLISIPSQFETLTDSKGEPLKNQDGTPQQYISKDDPAFSFVSNNFHPFATTYMDASGYIEMRSYFCSSSTNANLLITEALSSIAWGELPFYSRYGLSSTDIGKTINADNVTNGMWAIPYYGTSNFYFIPKFTQFTKQESLDASNFLPYANIPVLRMEEVLLNRAEAYLMLNQYDKAIADLNLYASQRFVIARSPASSRYYDSKELCITRDKILNFYKTKLNNTDHFINKYNQTDSWSDLKKGILLAILDFRSIEFYNEGLRWYDIVRWNIPVTHTQANGSKSSLMPDDDRRVLQIPEMATISGIKLNPRNNVNNTWV